jgi:hypothetical protein
MSARQDDHTERSDPKVELTGRSAEILNAIDDLHDMEVRKRERPISTPEFHDLAEDITAKSREVFRIAVEQEDVGEEAPSGDESINDVARQELRGG